MDDLSLIKKPLNELLLSEEFKKMAEMNGFENLEEILSFPAASLLQRPGASYHLYKELADYLEENKLFHLFRHQY